MLQPGTIYFKEPLRPPPVKKSSEKPKEVIKNQLKNEEIPREKEAEKEVRKEMDEIEKNKQDLDKLVERTEQPLYKFSEALPFLIKTKEVVIDINQVTVIYKQILGAKQVHGIPIEDIADVTAETIPIFATLKIYEGEYGTNNFTAVKYLKKDVAVKARRLIQGLMIAKKNKINLLEIPPEELKEKLTILGQKDEKA